jgi:hypothetical protein
VFQSLISTFVVYLEPFQLVYTQSQTYKPKEDSTTKFQCTSQLDGLLYPSPATDDIYMLEFIDYCGKRVDVTNLDIYDIGQFGDRKRQMIYPMGSMPDARGTVDLYSLSPGSVVEICANNEVLNRVSFIYAKGDAQPCIEKVAAVPWYAST